MRLYIRGDDVEDLDRSGRVGKAVRCVEWFVLVARNSVSADIPEIVPGADEEAVEEERAVAFVICCAVPFCEYLGRFLRAVRSLFAGSGNEIVDKMISRFHVR